MANLPSVFIGSSVEGLRVAEALQQGLQHDADVEVWSQGVFGLSYSYLDSLIKKLDEADFAVLILTSDDISETRGERVRVPRDNVLFELGLFMGRLGKDRCFFVYDRSAPPKLPSDLLGIAGAEYRLHESGNLESSLGAVATAIKRRTVALGRRPRLLRTFSRDDLTPSDIPAIAGRWLGYSPDGPEPTQTTSTMFVEQHGAFIRATIDREVRDGRRKFEYEGRLSSGQLVLFFEDVRGRGYIIGTLVLYLAGDLRSMVGRSTYYHHTKKTVVSTQRVYRRAE
jgi:hypothetical protein